MNTQPTAPRPSLPKRLARLAGITAFCTVIASLTLALMSLALSGLVLGAILGGSGGEDSGIDPTGNEGLVGPEVLEGSHVPLPTTEEDTAIGPPAEATVLLEVTTTTPATVYWTEPGSSNDEEITGPWSKELTGEPDDFYNVTVSSTDYETPGEVSCRITVAGEVVEENTGTGTGAMADCSTL